MEAGRWLLKTEPSVYSYGQLEKDKKTVWDGVTNALALKNLRQVKKGDRVFIYHTGDEKSAVGIAEAASDAYADPKQNNPKLAVVELRPVEKLPQPVTLAQIKNTASLQNWDLVRLGRLSVMAVTPQQWETVLKLAGRKE